MFYINLILTHMNTMRVSSFVYVKFCGTNGNKVSSLEVVAVLGDCRDIFTDWGSFVLCM